MKQLFFFVFTIFVISSNIAQKEITLEDIWSKGTFRAKSVPGFNFMHDGIHYSTSEGTKIKEYDLISGKFVRDIIDVASLGEKALKDGFDGYVFSDDEQKIIFSTESQNIYRRSSIGYYYIVDLTTKIVTPIFKDGKHRDVSLSPDGKKVAFCYNNNLYYKDLQSGKVVQITKDGKKNSIINGTTDWVYEEEFEFTKFYQWSTDGKTIAFVRSDESKVPEFTMTLYKNELYPEYETFKYPKVGEENSKVELFLYQIEKKKTIKIDLGNNFEYIPRLKWTKDPNKCCVYKMNRFQNDLELLIVDAKSGKTTSLLKETNDKYIEINDDLTFLGDTKRFIWSSEKDGYRHLYLYDMNGKLIKQLTKGNWEVTNYYGLDESKNVLYFQSTAISPLQRNVYELDLSAGSSRVITAKPGTNDAQFSPSFEYFVNTYSNINTPAEFGVYNRDGNEVRMIEQNKDLAQKAKDYGFEKVEFFSFKTADNTELNGYMIKPSNFDANKKYPVFMNLYGGPGSQQVLDKWSGGDRYWYQMMADKGYIIACVDNRGTGGRGEAFKKCTYLTLGKLETADQIEAAKYLGNLPYADKNRIGIFGWSYGGFMSSSCLFKGNDVFKAAISVAPVTSWRWYDNIYTERYMQTEKTNPSGYKENSPVNFADKMKGNLLLVHGMADDNVHFQNSAELVNALVKANKQFDTYYYPNRNHGIYGGNTRLHLYTKMTNFLLEKL